VLSLVELLAGAALAVAPFASPPSASGGLRLIVGAVILLLASTVRHGMRLGKARHARRLSESARLRTYVQYLSKSGDE
jgi:hypothetical protein